MSDVRLLQADMAQGRTGGFVRRVESATHSRHPKASVTLTELRYLTALAQEQHFGRAAGRCHVSQPTLSIAIRKLEEDLSAFQHLRAAELTASTRHSIRGSTLETLRHMVASRLGITILPLAATQLPLYSSKVLTIRREKTAGIPLRFERPCCLGHERG